METYPLDQEKTYNSTDLLTLECEGGPETRKIGEWLNVDPVRIHRMVVREKVLKVDQMEVFAPLVSKLRRADYEYYKRITGLKMLIDFPGYTSEVEAKIPYDTDPIAFSYQFKLFQKVSVMEPKVMLKKDIEFVKNF